MTSSWIKTLARHSSPQIQLFCLPHAGGNAALYRGWREILPPEIELNLICYPGRLDRLQQRMPTLMSELVRELADAIAPILNKNWAILGHSMGAVVAHETVLELQRRGRASPILLAVSAREAPQFHKPGILHQQDDDALCNELLRLKGTDPVLLAMPEIRELILPTMRGDYAMIEQWQLSSSQPLECPIAAFVGNEDPELSVQHAQGWSSWTSTGFTLDRFDGGHFYFSDNPQPLIERLRERLYQYQTVS